MNIGRTSRDAAAIAAIALICAAVSVSPPLRAVHGWSIDILTALRWEMFGKRHDPASSPAVVVAIDEESYRASPFKGSPTLTWTSEIGRVLGAIVEGGAKAVVAAPAAKLDIGKGKIERPTETVLAKALAYAAAKEKAEKAFVNPKVEPGKVRWHSDFATARTAAAKSGKPVLLFQMMGKLDDQFC